MRAKGRVAPSNYHHVILNDAQLDWLMLGSNYKEVVSLAVDSEPANGQAFVTEYAGSSAVVTTDGLLSDAWDHAAFAELKPVEVVDALAAQGLIECNGARCTYNHPLIQGLLYQYLPIPEDVEEGDFYSCLECYEGLIDSDAYDPAEFSADLLERIIEPGIHAVELLETWPYLTRLYTTMSAAEMTEDPFFHENSDLPDFGGNPYIATQFFPCSGSTQWQLPSGFNVVGNFQTWPEMPEAMPWAQRVELVPPAGAPQVEVDNTQLIDMLLGELKVRPGVLWSRQDCHGSDSSNDASSSSGSSATASATGGFDDDGSCACRSDGRDPTGAGLLALISLALLRRRRPA